MNIRMQRALDALDDERMEPHGFWAFNPDTEMYLESARSAQAEMNEWIAEVVATTPGSVRFHVPEVDY